VTPFLCSAADLLLIRAEHLPNVILDRAVKSGTTSVGPGRRCSLGIFYSSLV
jgi:hypothetical protein